MRMRTWLSLGTGCSSSWICMTSGGPYRRYTAAFMRRWPSMVTSLRLLSKFAFERQRQTLLRFALRDVNDRRTTTAVIRVSSIFSRMLQLFSRAEFERAVMEHRAERDARGFTCWGQFVAMLFCHLGRAQSLREICGGLAASEGKLRHLGAAGRTQALDLGLCKSTSSLAVVSQC